MFICNQHIKMFSSSKTFSPPFLSPFNNSLMLKACHFCWRKTIPRKKSIVSVSLISLFPQIFCLQFGLHFAQWLEKTQTRIVKRKRYLLELWLLFLFTRATLRKEFLHTGFLINFTSKFQYTVFTLAWVKKPKTTKQIVRVPLVLASIELNWRFCYTGIMLVLWWCFYN